MTPSMKNILIGLFVIAGIALFISLVLFLRPRVGDEKQTLFVRFSTINKMNVGTRVLFAGKAVGEVTEITEIHHARETQPSDELGRLYFYQLTLKVDSSVRVYSTDEISVETSGLMGERSIAIIPKTPPTGAIPTMITAQTPVYADSIDPIENTINRLSSIGDKLDTTAGLMQGWFQQNAAELSRAVSAFGSAMTQIHIATETLNQEQLLTQLKEGVIAFTCVMKQIDHAFTVLQQGNTLENLGVVMTHLKTGSASFDALCKELSDPRGTLGKLLHNDDLYLRLTALMSKADTMMNDINHYGILFHLNKGWQRTRTKQLNAMNALQTARSFKEYFQTEIDQINTAMSRLSIFIDKTHEEEASLLKMPQFRENFTELMRKVTEMLDNLHLYNEQLIEATGPTSPP